MNVRRKHFSFSADFYRSELPRLPFLRRSSNNEFRNNFPRSYDPISLLENSPIEEKLRQFEAEPWRKPNPEPLRRVAFRSPVGKSSRIPTEISSLDDFLVSTVSENVRLKNDLDSMLDEVQHLNSSFFSETKKISFSFYSVYPFFRNASDRTNSAQ